MTGNTASDQPWSQVVGTYTIGSYGSHSYVDPYSGFSDDYPWVEGCPDFGVTLSDKKPFAMEDVIGFSHDIGVFAYLDKERNAWAQSLMPREDEKYRSVEYSRDVVFSPRGNRGEFLMGNVASVDCGWNTYCLVTKSGDLYYGQFCFGAWNEGMSKGAEGVTDAHVLQHPGAHSYIADGYYSILYNNGVMDIGWPWCLEIPGVALSENTYGYMQSIDMHMVVLNGGTLRGYWTQYPLGRRDWETSHLATEVSADFATGVRRILQVVAGALVYESRDNSVSVLKWPGAVAEGDTRLGHEAGVFSIPLEGRGVLKGAGFKDINTVLYLREDGALRMYSLETGLTQVIANRVAQFSNGAFVKQYSGSPIYRYRNKATGSWLFTVSLKEAENVEQSGEWEWECFSHGVPLESDGGNPVHRLFNKISGAHFYTMSETEKNAVLENMPEVFEYEGVAFHAFGYQAQGTLPVYRFYAPKTASHFFTISEEEKDWIVANVPASDLKFEGVAWYAWPW